METDSWARFSARHQPAVHSHSDLYLGFDEVDGEEEPCELRRCSFCGEDFDIMELCYHVEDEHPVEAKIGLCPVCINIVGTDLVGHITGHHHRRRLSKGSSGSHSMFYKSRKDPRDGNSHALLGGFTYKPAPSNPTPDPLLSSFIFNIPLDDISADIQPNSLPEESVAKMSTDEFTKSGEPSVCDEKDRQERAQRSAFVQDLLLSTIFE